MAYTTIDDPGLFFDVNLWTGNSTTPRAFTGVGFQGDFLWIKSRNEGTDFELNDSVRGVSKYINSNTAIVEGTETQGLISFDTDGYTLGDANYWNWTAKTFVGWCWKAGTTVVPSGGTITPSACSFNTTTGFGIYKYTGTGSAATIAHGLTHAPEIMLVKSIDTTAHTWGCYNNTAGNGMMLVLNNTAAEVGPDAQYWNSTSPTTTLFSVGTDSYQNQSGTQYVAYCFSSIKGFSHCGGYTGNGNANGTFVYCGFRPAWLMIKCNSAAGNSWNIYDHKRPTTYYGNVVTELLEADTSNVTLTNSSFDIDLLSNGFKCMGNESGINQNAAEYSYLAFAEAPFSNSNSVPCNAR